MLYLAAAVDLVLAALHVAIAAVGPPAYRYFRAGEAFARAAEAGDWRPAAETLAIAVMFAVWGGYALSGAGAVVRLPLLPAVLGLVTLAFLGRGIALLPQLAGRRWFTAGKPVAGRDLAFSAVALLAGLVHLVGLGQLPQP